MIGRLTWLFQHLDEYLDRWIGFCNVGPSVVGSIVEGDLHICLVIALDLIHEELRSLVGATAFKERWAEFSDLVRRINSETDRSIGKQLEAKFEAARKELQSLSLDG